MTAELAPGPPKAPAMPLHISRRTHRVTDGSSLADTSRLLGRPLWPWQTDFADVALERKADRWHYPIVTVCVPRQSGKTTLVGMLCLHRCITQPDAMVWYTAQSRQDAVLRWRELVKVLRRSPLVELPGGTRNLADAPDWDYRVRMGVGTELVEFRNGSQLQVFSPAEDSLHGSVTDLIVLDEARFFDDVRGRGLMAAALPTQATRDGQVWIVSTGGGPASTFLASELEASRAAVRQGSARRAHVEYGIGADVPDGQLLQAVWGAHPSAGEPGGPNIDALTVACDAMPAWQFAHEYGNRWRSAADARLIPQDAWERGEVPTMPDDGQVALGVDVAVDRSAAAVVACVAGVLQVLDLRPGVTWLADRVTDLAQRLDAPVVAIDEAGPAGSVAAELRPRLPQLQVTSTRALTAACGAVQDALLTDPPQLLHVPSPQLDLAVAVAAHRKVGQAWVWSRVDSGPLMVAATLAWWGHQQALAAPVTDEPMIW